MVARSSQHIWRLLSIILGLLVWLVVGDARKWWGQKKKREIFVICWIFNIKIRFLYHLLKTIIHFIVLNDNQQSHTHTHLHIYPDFCVCNFSSANDFICESYFNLKIQFSKEYQMKKTNNLHNEIISPVRTFGLQLKRFAREWSGERERYGIWLRTKTWLDATVPFQWPLVIFTKIGFSKIIFI